MVEAAARDGRLKNVSLEAYYYGTLVPKLRIEPPVQAALQKAGFEAPAEKGTAR